MKMMIAAIALALPAVAQAGSAPAPSPSETPKMKCCCMDKAEPMACCKDRDRGAESKGEHQGHDKDGHRR